MTKHGLKARVIALTIIPTIVIGTLLAAYFTFNRYQQLEDLVIEQARSIADPLAIAAEIGMQQKNRRYLRNLIGVTHRKHSPSIITIAIYKADNTMFMNSNYDRNIGRLKLQKDKPIPEATEVEVFDNYIVVRTPIIGEDNLSDYPLPLPLEEQSNKLGYVAMLVSTDRALLLQFRDTSSAIFIVLLGIVISIIFSFRQVKNVTEPITSMVKAVDKIREGRLDTRVHGSFTGELGMLKNGINSMAKSMSEYHEEMQQSIDQATSDLRETLEQIEIQNVELDMAKKRAQEAARVKSEFLANMSHELRTPLNGVIGFARQLLKTSLSPSQTDYLQTIEKSANNLLNIINDILDFSKLEAGKLVLENIPFALRDTVDEVITLLAPSAHDKDLEISLMVDHDVPSGAVGDPLRFQQVLTNLIGNAIKFTEMGNVEIQMSMMGEQDGKLILKTMVSDTGIGISEKQQAQLFEAFGQADTSITRRYGGTGLGLVITQKLVQQMGGEIELVSSLNHGSTFWFTIALDASPMPMSDPLPISSLKSQPVLVFEADEFSARSFSQQLQQWKMQVFLAQTTERWHDLLSDRYQNIIIGHSDNTHIGPLLKRVTEAKEYCDSVVVYLNTASPEIKADILARGATKVLTKPVNQRKFAAALTDIQVDLEPSPVIKITPDDKQSRLKVMAVDDNPANLKLISAMLDDLVAEVTTATNGREAVDKSNEQTYDIIFMDIQMPILDGISACQMIRKGDTNQTTPIIAVTAHAIAGEREKLIDQGMDDYLSKPIDEKMLIQIIEKWAADSHEQQGEMHLDWELALRQSAGKPDLAKEMLTMLVDSFSEVESAIDKAMKQELDNQGLDAVIHKFHGGCSYSGVPQLQKLAALVETELKKGVDIDELEPELFELMDEIKKVEQAAETFLG